MKLGRQASLEEMLAAFRDFRAEPQDLGDVRERSPVHAHDPLALRGVELDAPAERCPPEPIRSTTIL